MKGKDLIRWFLKGLIFAILHAIIFVAYFVLYGVLVNALGGIFAALTILPMIFFAFVISGFLIEWVNKVIK